MAHHQESVSLLEFVEEIGPTITNTKLDTLWVPPDGSYVSLFTQQGTKVERHYLEATETWNKGYVICPGESCPICATGGKPQEIILLPVVDMLAGMVKILEVPVRYGPGTLLGEIAPALKADEPEKLLLHITREPGNTYAVSIQAQAELDPEIAAAIKAFSKRADEEGIDLTESLHKPSVEDLLTHERVARLVRLTGGLSDGTS